jgi:outer membrane autotransporter protein
VSSAVASRQLNKGVASGEAGSETHLWVRVFGSQAEQDDKSDAAGFEVDSVGVVVGFDAYIGDTWNVGLAVGYSDLDAEDDSPLLNHEIDITGFQIAGYADWAGNDGSFAEVIGLIGFNENESERHINFAGLNRVAEGDYDSDYTHISAAYGRSFAINDGFTLSPVVHLGYTVVDDDSYVEFGADDLNLDVDSNDSESLILGVDGRGAFELNENGSQITGYVGLGFDLISDDTILAAAFAGGGPIFSTPIEESDDFLIRAGIGVEWIVSEMGEVHVRYDYENRDDFTNQLLTATFRWSF